MQTSSYVVMLVLLLMFISACSDGGTSVNPESGSDMTKPADSGLGGQVNGFTRVGSFSYDEEGRLTGSATYEYHPTTRTQLWTSFDHTGAIRYSSVCRFDTYGAISDCENYDAYGAYTYSTYYTYVGRLATRSRRFNRSTDRIIRIVDFTYDESDNLNNRIYYSVNRNGGLEEFRRVTFEFDADNRVVSSFNFYDSDYWFVNTFEYNAANQLARKSWVSNKGIRAWTSWEYNEFGNMIRLINSDSTEFYRTEYEYEPSRFPFTNISPGKLSIWM